MGDMNYRRERRMVWGWWRVVYWISILLMGYGFLVILSHGPLEDWLPYLLAGIILEVVSLISVNERRKKYLENELDKKGLEDESSN